MALAALFSHTTLLHTNNLIQTKLHCNVEKRNACFQTAKAAAPRSLKFRVRNNQQGGFTLNKEGNLPNFDWSEVVEQERKEEEEEDYEDEGSPWEGAVVYTRNASVSHLEYCTTLERLGLAMISTELSRSRASVMGIRVTKDVKDYPEGTPVLVSLGVTPKKKKIRIDGIIRTVITLACNRCGEPVAESVFSNFSILLTEEPIEEPETVDMGTIFGSNKFGTIQDFEEDDDSSIDIEDQLYFPKQNTTIDISKHIRDLVHLEITLNAICDPKCKGLCFNCGSNLNIKSCKCDKKNMVKKASSPFQGLRQKMQQR